MRFDVALAYCTGHGVEIDGQVFLLPGDYPFHDGYSRASLRAKAISMAKLASAARAAKINLNFFAGCRTRVAEQE